MTVVRQDVIRLIAAAAGFALYSYMFGLGLVFSGHPFWGNPKADMLTNVVGYEALLQAPWRLPLTVVSTLADSPVSIVYTDSIPWLSLLLKAVGLGAVFNPLGLFLALSYPLQAMGMMSLLRALGVSRPGYLLGGALMALMFPPWLARQFGHIALSGHWIILFALALSVASSRFGLTKSRVAGFAVLAATATGVHAYHLIPIAACFGAALASDLAQHRAEAIRRVAVAAMIVGASVAITAMLLGYSSGRGPSGGPDVIGVYSMNALGPVWPEASLLFGQVWQDDWFKNTLDANGTQSFEGFQFLGSGALLLLLIMLGGILWKVAKGRHLERDMVLRWTPLAAAMVLLTLWAIGPVVYVGPWLAVKIPKPAGSVGDMLAFFRCHGRFFWAAGYLLTACGVAWASRLPPRLGATLFVAVIALQAFDTTPLRAAVRATFAAPAPAMFSDAFGRSSAIQARPWVFIPTYSCTPTHADQRAIEELTLLIVRTHGRSNTAYTARSIDPPCDTIPPLVSRDAALGDQRITVVMNNYRPEGGFLRLVEQRSDCYLFGRGAMCGRNLESVAGLTKVTPGEFAPNSRRQLFLLRGDLGVKPAGFGEGWAQPDPGAKAIWSTVHQASLILLPHSAASGTAGTVDITAWGFSDLPFRPQPIAVRIEGVLIGSASIEPGHFYTYRFKIPPGVLKFGQPMTMTIDMPDARTSATDPRLLGIALQRLSIAADASKR